MLDGLLRRQRMSLRPCLLERPFPERPTDRAHGTLVLGVPCRWEGGQPISSRSAAVVPQSCAALSILPCATATLARPSRQSEMVCLRPVRHANSRPSSYRPHARAYSPASHATLPRLASVRTMPHAFSVLRAKARPSFSSVLARPRSPCPRAASARARRL